MPKSLHRRFGSSLAALSLMPLTALGGEPSNVGAGEIAMLPVYCADKVWAGSQPSAERRAHWRALLGPSWDGLHHYCWGLVNVRRVTLSAMPPQTKQFLLAEAISDYVFSIEHSTSDFILLPELLTRLGEAQVLAGKQAEAIASFERAVKVKADYWPAHERLAETYERSGLRKRATEAARRGLIAIPGHSGLMEIFVRNGGDASQLDLVAGAKASSGTLQNAPPAPDR